MGQKVTGEYAQKLEMFTHLGAQTGARNVCGCILSVLRQEIIQIIMSGKESTTMITRDAGFTPTVMMKQHRIRRNVRKHVEVVMGNNT
jgi:hypothetical protein